MELKEMSLSQVAAGFAKKAFSYSEYAEALILQADKCASLNAWTARDSAALMHSVSEMDAYSKSKPEQVYALTGIPIALKDNINTTQLPTTGATRALQGRMPLQNAVVANRIFDAGGLLAGKTNMHELAFGATTNNAVTGTCRNPWNPKMIPGGSSGGSAVVVAARMVPAALGTDTGASVRLPAALCGVVGFRPTVGRYSNAGVIPISHTRDTVGPITRNVHDAALMDSVLANCSVGLQRLPLTGIRLGIARKQFFVDADSEVLDVVETALRLLSQHGVELIEIDVPDIAHLNTAIGNQNALYEFMRDMPIYLQSSGYSLSVNELIRQIESPDVLAILQTQTNGKGVSSTAYLQAIENCKQLRSVYAAHFSKFSLDAIVFPTALLPACPIEQGETITLNGVSVPAFRTLIRNTSPSSNAALPGISIPIGLTSSGLPVGLELDGAFGADRHLLSLAASIEAVLPPMPAPNV